jgi:hypothetical protein
MWSVVEPREIVKTTKSILSNIYFSTPRSPEGCSESGGFDSFAHRAPIVKANQSSFLLIIETEDYLTSGRSLFIVFTQVTNIKDVLNRPDSDELSCGRDVIGHMNQKTKQHLLNLIIVQTFSGFSYSLTSLSKSFF